MLSSKFKFNLKLFNRDEILKADSFKKSATFIYFKLEQSYLIFSPTHLKEVIFTVFASSEGVSISTSELEMLSVCKYVMQSYISEVLQKYAYALILKKEHFE